LQFHRQHIRRPAREHAQVGPRPDHSIGDFVDRSVAAQHQDQVRAIAHGLRREFGGVSRAVGGNEPRAQTRAAECVSGTL
jgi:hypothetical protein